jgi:hypothetical protein
VKKFLNRLIGLPIAGQRRLFDAFTEQLEEIIWAARRDGKYDEGITDVTGSSVTLEQEEATLWTDPISRAQTRCALVQIDRGVSYKEALAKLDEARHSK